MQFFSRFFLHFFYINEILLKYAKKLGDSMSKSKQIPEKKSRNRRKSLKDASYNTTLMKKASILFASWASSFANNSFQFL